MKDNPRAPFNGYSTEKFTTVREVADAWAAKKLREQDLIRTIGLWDYRSGTQTWADVEALINEGRITDYMYDAALEMYAWEVEKDA